MRLYHFSDGELIARGSAKIAFMRRDATEFSPFGITPTLVTAFEDDINIFAETLTDIEMVGDQTGVTHDKDAKGEELRVAIRSVMSRVELKFSVKSKQYRKFGV